MKHKFSFLMLLTCLSLSLVSCNKSLNEPKNFESKIIEYKEEVSNIKIKSYEDKLKKHKLQNSQRDYVIEEYEYTSQLQTFTDDKTLTVESVTNQHSTIKMDYENHLRQEHRIMDKTSKRDSVDLNSEETNHTVEDFGYQEIDGLTYLIEKTDKIIRDVPRKWDDIVLNTYPQDDLLIDLILSFEDGKCYIDNENTFTCVTNIDNDNVKMEKLIQLVINDDKITYLKLIKSRTQNKLMFNEIDDIVEAYYKEINFKDITLKPYNLKGFKVKGLVD